MMQPTSSDVLLNYFDELLYESSQGGPSLHPVIPSRLHQTRPPQ